MELAGCSVSYVFLFPLSVVPKSETETLWTRGMRDLKHFIEKCEKHESGRSHLNNSLMLNVAKPSTWMKGTELAVVRLSRPCVVMMTARTLITQGHSVGGLLCLT